MDNLFYVDTNVIISLIENDSNYSKAERIMRLNNLVTGEVTLLELISFYSRKLKDEILAKASAKYAIRLANVKVVEIDANKLLKKAIELSPKLQLKTLDVIQIVSAILINSAVFVTFDSDILKKKEIVMRYSGIKVTDFITS
ncbi:VapC-type toxin [Acidianus hospitalis W1]|uniref:VapC-type toxin n=1 Tax=Acidianus hospitalis (strain W1) TaxID=933801 RepID=F4B8H7_ACIHW|nr:PIN domain-containing protein [Acidianus hospitalis]AEE94929.1 VapC-type toxin [Acidianus hospitalis W1]